MTETDRLVTIHYFKPSGKWCYTGTFIAPQETVFFYNGIAHHVNPHQVIAYLERIDKAPGILSNWRQAKEEFFIAVVPADGYPYLITEAKPWE